MDSKQLRVIMLGILAVACVIGAVGLFVVGHNDGGACLLIVAVLARLGM